MRKRMYQLILGILVLMVSITVSLPVYAMTDEEKELFDMLGVDYTVDENGDFESFTVDVNHPRFTEEQSQALSEKYNQNTKVGGYDFYVEQGRYGDSAAMIYDKSGKLIFWLDYDEVLGTSVIYINKNGDFTALHYKHDFTGSPIEYSKGNTEIGEYGCNPRGDYRRQEDGSYQLYQEETGKEFIEYDEEGNILRRQDYETGITYDGQDNPIAKKINTTDKAGWYSSVPYDVAEEIQQLIDKNNGSFNIYDEKTGCYKTMPEIDQLLDESNTARALGMTLEEYREKYNKYISPDIPADIFEEEGKDTWNTWEAVREDEIPSCISKTEIVEELTKLLNNYRVENGLNQLDMSDALLQSVADLRAEESTYVMNKEHSRPMAGKAPQSFQIGENVAKLALTQAKTSQEIAQLMFEAWKKSEGHNANMLNGDYKQAAFGVAFVKEGDKLVIYVSNDFSLYEDYQNEVPDTVKKRIEVGAQTPDNVGSLDGYYEKLYTEGNFQNPGKENDMQTAPAEGTSPATEGGIGYGLQVLDEDGNRFVLPNGAEWTQVEADLTDAPVVWGPDGTEYCALQGHLRFYCTDGQTYHIYICEESIDPDPYDTSLEYYLNHYTGDTIMLKQSEFQTVDSRFPGGYTVNVASRNCYYIVNGETVVIDISAQ